MRYYLFALSMLFLATQQVHAQLHDNMWLFANADTIFQVDFRESPPIIETKDNDLKISSTSASYCTNAGNLLFQTDCIKINNKNNMLVENGDSINIGYFADNGNIPSVFGCYFLPAPGDSNHCYLVYMSPEYFPGTAPIPTKVQYALIDINANNGEGKVVLKRVPIIVGGLDFNFNHSGAVRHANGRDWWIIVPNRMEPKYYKFLLSDTGFLDYGNQEIGVKVTTSDPNYYIGFNLFSQDGSIYMDFEYRTGVMQMFDFDRCTGMFSNPRQFQTQHSVNFPPVLMGGFALSPSGKKLYASYGSSFGDAIQLKQYDLEAQDIAGSAISIYSCDIPNQYECSIGRLALALDDKIYIEALIDSVAFHVISLPNNTGSDCGFENGGLVFPLKYPQSEMPYTPNYRLYDVPGSACDTLGIDAPVSAVEEEGETEYKATVHPNPATDRATISLPAPLPQPATWLLFDALGREVARAVLSAGQQEAQVGLSGVPPGLYFWQVGNGEGTLGTGKLIIAK